MRRMVLVLVTLVFGGCDTGGVLTIEGCGSNAACETSDGGWFCADSGTCPVDPAMVSCDPKCAVKMGDTRCWAPCDAGSLDCCLVE